MGIKANFTQADVRKALEERMAKIDLAIINRLRVLGEQCVNVARTQRGYKDQTGNLVNSTGYVVLKHGEIIKSDFRRSATITTQTKTGKQRTSKGSKDGVLVGEEYAKALAKKYPRGYVLIVVAGMKYAAAVEAKGRDVLTTAEQYAKENLPRMIEQLKTNISKMK